MNATELEATIRRRGHGHVLASPHKARCGGSRICYVCLLEETLVKLVGVVPDQLAGAAPPPRDFFAVTQRLERLVPAIASRIAAIRTSAVYCPPEQLGDHWRRVAAVLEAEVPPSHEKFAQVQSAFNGWPDPAADPDMTNEA